MAHSLRARNPFLPCRRIALLAAGGIFALAGNARAGFDGSRSDGNGPRRFGFDSTKAYAHAGLEAGMAFGDPSGEYSRRLSAEANTAIQGLVQAHALRLVARLGAAAYSPFTQGAGVRESSGGYRRGGTFYEAGLSEASLRLRLGPSEADDGIQVGLLPLQGNPDAVLFGNYLARYHAFPMAQARGLAAWDSLGALAPEVAGLRLALGRDRGLVRAEGWLVRDGNDFSWLAYLSGRAIRKIGWGLGVSRYRAFTLQQALVTPRKSALYQASDPDSSRGVFTGTYSAASPADTAYYTYSVHLFSARASLDFASVSGSHAPEGRYGGVFAEAAVLGWNNQPTVYPDRWDRVLWTAGTRIPTFGWLDVCVAQVEWRRAEEYMRYGIGNGSWGPVPVGYGNNGIPAIDSSGPAPAGQARPRRASPWKYSLLLAKGLGPHAEVQFRALSYESYEPYTGAMGQVNALARIVFRFR